MDETEERYLRLDTGGKVYYITKAEAMAEEVLAGPREELSEQAILVSEWNYRAEKAEQLRDQISLVHKMMRVDEQRPSQYRADYDALWDECRDAIDGLREIDSGSVNEFKDKVAARVKELEVKLNTMCDNWHPSSFDEFEQVLACYEKNYDLMMALQPGLPDQALALGMENGIHKQGRI